MSLFLTELDLSYNEIGDKGMWHLKSGLSETASLVKLNLSHNKLTEVAAEALERILSDNKTVIELDLSWNGFYTGPGTFLFYC